MRAEGGWWSTNDLPRPFWDSGGGEGKNRGVGETARNEGKECSHKIRNEKPGVAYGKNRGLSTQNGEHRKGGDKVPKGGVGAH